MVRHTLVAGLCLVAIAAVLALPAHAVDYPVTGKQLALREVNGKASLTLGLRDGAIPIPTPGSSDDPSLAGLTVVLFSRGTGERPSYDAPSGTGQNSWSVRTTPKGVVYDYKNGLATRFAGDLQTVGVRPVTGLKVRSKAAGLALVAPQGGVAVRVQYGSVRVCALFDGDSVHADRAGVFMARNATAALANCDDDTLATAAPPACGGTFPSCEGACPTGETCGAIGGGTDPTCQCLPDEPCPGGCPVPIRG
jgi:hypothetical protein